MFNPVPLYADTLFTITAAFFGPLCGCITAFLFHTLCTIAHSFPYTTLYWTVCSLTLVLIIRLYIKKRPVLEIFDMVFLVLISALAMSFEGACVFTIIHIPHAYTEDSQVRLVYALLSKSLPVFFAALLPRVPVNILDKAISIPLGYFCFIGVKKLIELFKKSRFDF